MSRTMRPSGRGWAAALLPLAIAVSFAFTAGANAASFELRPCAQTWTPQPGSSTSFSLSRSCPARMTLSAEQPTETGAKAVWDFAAPVGVAAATMTLSSDDGSGEAPALLVRSCPTCPEFDVPAGGDGPVEIAMNAGNGAIPEEGGGIQLVAECRAAGGCGAGARLYVDDLVFVATDAAAPFNAGPFPYSAGTVDWDGWNRGVRRLDFDSYDDGTGLAEINVRIDDETYGRHVIEPCAQQVQPFTALCFGWQFMSVELVTYWFANGVRDVHVKLRDLAGNWSEEQTYPLRLDNQAPGQPADLTIAGASGDWVTDPAVDLRWRNTGEVLESATQSGIEVAYVDVDPVTPGLPNPGSAAHAEALDSVNDITLPAEGVWDLSVKLRDRAWNVGPIRTIRVGYDGAAPEVALAPFDPARPTRVRATASDATSGTATLALEYRREAGDGRWWPLEGVLSAPSGQSVAATGLIPDVGSPAGAYLVRAAAEDRAGNRSTDIRRVDLPLRAASALAVPFTAQPGAPRGGDLCHGDSPTHTLTRGFGRRTVVRGRLDGPGDGARLVVTASRGIDARSLSTGPGGEFAFTVPPGPSSVVTIRFAGDELRLPVCVRLAVLTRASVVLQSLRGGRDRIVARGRLRTAGVKLPAAGVPVQLRVRLRKGWIDLADPALVADRSGRFVIRASLPVSRPTKLRIRAESHQARGWPFVEGASRTLVTTVR